MPTQRIPLFGSLTNRNQDPLNYLGRDQRFINCYPVVNQNPISGRTTVTLNKRPGYTSSSALTGVSAGSYGACVWASKADGTAPSVFSFVNNPNTSCSVWRSDGTKVGGDIANTSKCLFLSDTVISGTGNLVGLFTDSSTEAIEAWFYPEGGAWTQITDGDFPPNIGTPEPLTPYIVHMDGFMFVMSTNGKIWSSNLNSLSGWTATDFLTASAYPDGGAGISRYKDYIVGFGRDSAQFFYNAGNATGSPLLPVNGGSFRIGARLNPNKEWPLILQANDTVYWVGVATESGQFGIYRLNGLQAGKISNPAVDNLLNTTVVSTGTKDGFAGAFTSHGLSHIMLAIGDSAQGRQLCYCVETNLWWIRDDDELNDRPIGRILGNGAAVHHTHLAGTASTKIHTQSSEFLDGSTAVTATAQLGALDFGTTNRKFAHSVDLIGDNQSSGTTTLSASDDDYVTDTTLGTFDMTLSRKRITRCGSHKNGRSYKLVHTANTPWRVEALEIRYSEGTS